MPLPTSKNIVVVIPTIREHSITRFLREWQSHFEQYKVKVIIVEDNPSQSFLIKPDFFSFAVSHYAWQDIEKELGDNAWIISRRDSGIRSFGYWKAYQQSPDMIVTLDDDCYPLANYLPVQEYDFLQTHFEKLYKGETVVEEDAWESTAIGIRPRGIPYKNTRRKKTVNNLKVLLNHGLWYNVPDLDAPNQLTVAYPSQGYLINKYISPGKYFPMCGMNLAFKPEAVPALYFSLMGEDGRGKKWGFHRFDDIWAGIFLKKIADHLGYSILSGDPAIWHDRASNTFVNLKKEAPGLEMNELVWPAVDQVTLTRDNIKDCYQELAGQLTLEGDYWDKARKAMKIWADLF